MNEAYAPDGTAVTNRYIYKDWLVLAITDGGGNILETYTHGADLSGTLEAAGGIGGLLVCTYASSPATPLYHHTDPVGNIIALTDVSGVLAFTFQYSPFDQLSSRACEISIRHLFSTKEYDDSIGLNYYGYRYYSPTLSRWISPDPTSERGGLNLYGFIWNRPTRIYDPLGLAPQLCGIDSRGMPIYCDDPDPCWGHCPPPPTKGPWYDELPDCPCSIPLDNNGCPSSDGAGPDWTNPKKTGHKGGTWEIRGGGEGFLAPGQQCVYDSTGKLINQGAAAGTPDSVSPSGGVVDFVAHCVFDGWQWLCGTDYDHATHPPNQGSDRFGNPCPPNDGSGAPPPDQKCCD